MSLKSLLWYLVQDIEEGLNMVEFNSDNYKSSHGKAPRGTGQWVFGIRRGHAWTSFSQKGSFGDAKKAALREARSLGADLVIVKS